MAYLGIDCGTQSLKVLLWSPEEGTKAVSSQSYGLIDNLPPGHKEQHPSSWIDALELCLEELSARADLGTVRAVGVSGQQHGLVVLDQSDRPIRPAKLWNDTSTQSQCREIIEGTGGQEAYQKEIGNDLPPGFTASKILWLKQNEPDSYSRIHSLMLPHDYLNFHLTGEKVTEAGDASGTGYFRVRERTWSRTVLQAIDGENDLSACLPRLVSSGEPAGTLRSEIVQKWGFRPEVIVSSGGGDNMMGAIGSGNVRSGVMTVSLGTSGTLYSYSPEPVIDPRGEIAAFCDSTGGWLPLGCTMSVTVATEMVRKAILKGDHEVFENAVASAPAGCDGLLLLPYLEGERMPSVPDGTGVFFGLRPRTATPEYLARSAMEGVTFGLRYGLERMKSLGLEPTEIRLIGGGAKSPSWRQALSDIFNLPLASPEHEEGPAMGAALQAMWCHLGDEISQITKEHVGLDDSTRHEPEPEQVQTYEELYQLYLSLAEQLQAGPLFPQHRKLVETLR